LPVAGDLLAETVRVLSLAGELAVLGDCCRAALGTGVEVQPGSVTARISPIAAAALGRARAALGTRQ
jgi:hypothetical protein